ncbi:MAG: 1-aminocyclopropane-1-carboxylate deaminase/D-cysteine desulfhydrase [Bacteroidia bacterium]
MTNLLNTDFPEQRKIPLQKIEDDLLKEKEISLYVLRLDLVHPYVSGNKWFKLKYNLQEAKLQGKNTLLTFGGAYSNHIVATAAAGKEFGFKTIGIIRGEELNESDNSVLQFAKDCGMKLHFVSRDEYRKKDASTMLSMTSECYILPEGGTNDLAVKGSAEISSLIDIPFDYICCAVGTGGTIAGIISSLKENQKAIGFPVLKGGEFLKDEIEKFIPAKTNFELQTDYHFGGYAKKTEELMSFISDFKSNHNIPLDFVYTGKMMFGVFDLIERNYFQKGATIVAIHTGGLPQFADSKPRH